MKKPFPESTAQPEPDVVMPAPSFQLHAPKVDDGMVSEEEMNDLPPNIQIIPAGTPAKWAPNFEQVLIGNGFGNAPTTAPACFLYVERKPARIYQFPGRPSPGDLKRIERKQLSVFGLDGGKFVRFLPNGTTEPVSTHEETAAND